MLAGLIKKQNKILYNWLFLIDKTLLNTVYSKGEKLKNISEA